MNTPHRQKHENKLGSCGKCLGRKVITENNSTGENFPQKKRDLYFLGDFFVSSAVPPNYFPSSDQKIIIAIWVANCSYFFKKNINLQERRSGKTKQLDTDNSMRKTKTHKKN